MSPSCGPPRLLLKVIVLGRSTVFTPFLHLKSLKRSTFHPLLEAIVMQSVVESKVLQRKVSLWRSFNYYADCEKTREDMRFTWTTQDISVGFTFQLLFCYFGGNLVSIWQPRYGLQFHSCCRYVVIHIQMKQLNLHLT